MNSLVMANIESIVSVCNFSRKTFSPAVIELKPENISLNLIFRVIAHNFSYANECLRVSLNGMCKQYKCNEMLYTNLLTSWMQMTKNYPGRLELFFCLPSMNPQNERAFKHATRHVQGLCNSLSRTLGRQSPGNAIYKRKISSK